MNIKQAKQIPIEILATHLGGRQAHTKGHEVWYYSPFRPNESTPSFKVNLNLNTWYDFGHGHGGSVIDLWLDIHKHSRQDGNALRAALEALKSFKGHEPRATHSKAMGEALMAVERHSEVERFAFVKKPVRIWMDSLKDEMARRGISPSLGNHYLKQAYFKDNQTGKSFNGFAFGNDKGGFEISVPNPSKGKSFKTVIGDKSPTVIFNHESKIAYVFEGFWDFLSFLEMTGKQKPDQNIFILNSVSFVREVAEMLKSKKAEITTVVFFQDNDDAGEKGLALLAELLEPEGFAIGTLNHIYEGYKDLNDFWINDPQAKEKTRKRNEAKTYYDTALNQVKSKPKNTP